MDCKKDSVVFAKGTYKVECAHGYAVVTAPRDITLGEIAPALEKLYAGRKPDEPCEKKDAPRKPAKAREAHIHAA